MKAAIIGGGVIGGGWAARFLLNGWDVAVFDPAPDAARRIGEVLDNARRSLPGLYDLALPEEGALTFAGSIKEAVTGADWVQESAPERLDVKHGILADCLAHAPPDAVIGSSTSGFKPSDLQQGLERGDQVLVAHPFNPVYLLPLVEIVPSPATNPAITARCRDILDQIGMIPLVIGKEIDAHIADRLLEAVWREALWLVRDGVATTGEIDDAIRYGFGLRWAQMGLFETYRAAGGEAGMRHFIAQFGPALKWPWTKLMDVPDLTDDLIETIASQSDAQSGHLSIRELERLRDDNLVAILRALKANDAAAGAVLNAHDRKYAAPLSEDSDSPVDTVRRMVPQDWTGANGAMTPARHLEVFDQATARFMAMRDANYATTESRLCYLAAIKGGETISIKTRLMNLTQDTAHLSHRLYRGDGALAATGEHWIALVSPDAEVAEKSAI